MIATNEIMGDYLNNGEKIGTCGQAYYATLEMLKAHKGDKEADYYLNPSKGCSFAFPFPEYDGKQVGEISNFHEEDKVNFVISLPADKFQTYHDRMYTHISPKGVQGINVFFPCPYNGAETSSNFDESNVKLLLTEQMYVDGKLAAVAKCVCCGQRNILEDVEAVFVSEQIQEEAQRLQNQSKLDSYTTEEKTEKLKQANYLMKVASRLLKTYTE